MRGIHTLVWRLCGIATLMAQPIGVLPARPALAAPPAVPPLLRAINAPARRDTGSTVALPAWFARPSDVAASSGDPGFSEAGGALPAWFSSASVTDRYRTLDDNNDGDHHTIYPDRITITMPTQINNCDPVTVTIVAVNDAVTTTSVIVTSTMPTGFTPASQTFVVGSVAPNAVITLTAVHTASCGAVSGQHQLTLSQDGYPLITRLTNFVVNPGALTVRKEPAVIQARSGDIVTWTVYVENTGYGVISNVRVTDTLNSGLQYVAGVTSATYISIPVGETRSFQVSARVASCADLDNDVVATWGCDLCQINSAQASVDLIVDNPELTFTPPNIVLPYCAASTTISVPIRNVGDGAANFVRINVDMAPLSVTNLSPGAQYVTSPVPGFVLSNSILPGGVYTLTFDVSFANACAVGGGGALVFEPTYYDQCGNLFSIPARFGQWSRGEGGASLSVSKTMPREIQLGDVVTATIVVQAAGISGTVRVTDIIPPGWSVIDPAGGVITSVSGITQILWSGVTGTGVTTFTVVLQSPLTQTNVCALCGTTAVNVVQASAADCQSCGVTASSSAETQIECDLGVESEKTVAPASNESCSLYVYTNTFDFPASFSPGALWSSMRLTESLANAQAYVSGTLQVLVVNAGVTYTLAASPSLIGGLLVITFSDSVAVPVAGSRLIVRYQLETTAASQSPCADHEWYDWTELNIGADSGGLCGAGGVIREGLYVNSEAPRMSVSISGAPPIVSSCGIYTYTLTVRRDSSAPAYDTRLDVPTSTYAILEVIGFGNITPISVTSDSLGYHFYYGDAFTTGVTATVQLRVQLRCGSSGPLQASLVYDNRCANDDAPDAMCSAGGTLANPIALSPRLILYKFPELIYATGDVVTWTLTAINSGAGIAHSVTLTDALGAGLRYESSTITSTYGSAAGVTPITSTNLVTWTGLTILPGERYTIQYTARVVGCTDLTNRLYEQVGCLGQTCASIGPVQSRVILPPTVLINTNAALTPLGQCLTRTITATVRNGGLLSVYDAWITQTLPPGVTYVPGSTQYVTGTGATPPPTGWVSAGEPQVSVGPWGTYLVWTTTQIADLHTIAPRGTVFVRFDVRAGCGYVGGSINIQTRYRDVCGQALWTNPSNFFMPAIAPEITARKVARNVTTGSSFSDLTYASPGDVVVWQLWLTNTSSSPAFNLVTTDTLPANVVFVSASPAPAGVAGGIITWSLGTLTTTTWTALVTTTVAGGACTLTDTQNVFAATWGCEDGCRQGITATASLRTRPLFDPPSFLTEIAPASLSRCGGLITLTLVNNGPPAWNVYLTDTLPSGYFYQATVFSSTAPSLMPTPGTPTPAWGWTGGISLPTGVTTITFLVNSGLSGVCGAPVSGPNRIDVQYEDDPSCATGPYTATSNNTLTVLNPNLVVTKSPLTRFANAGDTITWTVRVTNTGAAAAPNIVVTDTLGSAFISATAGNGVYPAGSTTPVVAGNVITWTPPFTLAPGQSWVAVVTAVVTSSGVFRNEVTVAGACAAGCTYGQGNTTAFVTLFEQFRKGPPVQTGTIGSLVVFTISASLTSQSTEYQNLTLTDTLPAGLGYVASTLAYTYALPLSPTALISGTPTISPAYLASGLIVWRLGNLTGTVQIAGVITAVIQNIPTNTFGISRTNVVSMTYIDDGQTYVYTHTARVDILEPVLHLGKSHVTTPGCSATLFSDHFNTGLLSGWTISGTAWSVVDGMARSSTGGNQRLWQGSFAWTDYSFSTMFYSTDSSGDLGVLFRAQPVGAGGDNAYRVIWNSGGVNTLRLQRVVNGAATTLATAAGAYALNRWYHLEVRAVGSLLQVYVDGALVLSAVDTTFAAGRIGLYANNQTYAWFDDVLVTRLGNMGCYVGAGELITYTLTVSNQERLPAFDLVVTDTLPYGISLVTATLTTNAPGLMLLSQPISGATGLLTWTLNTLTPTTPYTALAHTAFTLTVVARVADWITANVTLMNQAGLSYTGQPGSGPVGIERGYSGGTHSTAVRTADGGLIKTVVFDPPPTATLGTLVTYTLIVPAQPLSATLYNVVITDAVHPSMTIAGVAAPAGLFTVTDQLITVTFASVPSYTQALITITARISSALGAVAGNVITNVGVMTHSTASVITTSNVVTTVIGEPRLLIAKSVASSAGALSGLDGTAQLTYTLRITNVGSSPAWSVHITDAVPAGVSVTAQFGGDARGILAGPPQVLTWTAQTISNVAPANVLVLTYTAVLSQAAVNATLTNLVTTTYTSLTETIPGVREYPPVTSTTPISTASPALSKSTQPPVLRIGDLVTYSLVFTIPPGLVALGGPDSYLRDALPPGVWYITDSETLTWTPASVDVTTTGRVSAAIAGAQVITWFFGQPITSAQDTPTVITLSFRAQVAGLTVDTLTPLFPNALVTVPITNTAGLWNNGSLVNQSSAGNDVIQPSLSIAKRSAPPSGAVVGANQIITYSLIVTNSGHAPAYDIFVQDALPPGLTFLTATIVSAAPPTITFMAEPVSGSVGAIGWQVNELWAGGVATITVLAQVTGTIGAGLTLTNTAAITSYDSQPDDGPGPYDPPQRVYTDGQDSVVHITPPPTAIKEIEPATITLGSVFVYRITWSPITATLHNLTLTDVVDSRLQVLDCAAIGSGAPPLGCAFSGQTVTGTWGSVPALTVAQLVITVTLRDPVAAQTGDLIPNAAAFTWTPVPTDTPPLTGVVPPVTSTVVEPRLTLVKASDPPTSNTVAAGAFVTYTVRVTNSNQITVSPAFGLRFTDTLPFGMRDATPLLLDVRINSAPVSPASFAFAYDGLTGLMTIVFSPTVALPPGAGLEIIYRARVDDDVSAGIDLTNQAAVSWQSLPDVPGLRDYGPITDTTTVHVGYPDLSLSKQAEPETVLPGDLITYTLRVTNTGLVSATGVLITDRLPLSVTFVSASAPYAGPDGAGVLTWTIGVLDVGAAREVTLAVRVNAGVITGTLLRNTGFLTSSEGLTDTDVVTTPVQAFVDVRLSKSVTPALAPAGARITYTIIVSSVGQQTALGVVVTDRVPDNTTFVDAAPAYSGPDASGVITWALGDLPPGSAVVITLVVQAPNPAPAGLTLTNTAWLTSSDGLTGTSVVTNVVDSRPDLHLLKQSEDVNGLPLEPGDVLLYRIVVSNTGTQTATQVTISDVAPLFTQYVPGSIAGGDARDDSAAPVLQWLINELPPNGAPVTLTFAVTLNAPLTNSLSIVNTAVVTSAENITRTDTVTDVVQSGHALSLTKQGGPAVVGPGGWITWVMIYTVTGNAPAPDVTLQDATPPGTVFVSAAPPPAVAPAPGAPGVVIWQFGTLNPPASGQVTLVAQVNAGVLSGTQIVNTAVLTDSSGLTTTDQVTSVVNVPLLVLSKHSAPPGGTTVRPGDYVTYTLVLTNVGSVTATQVFLTDAIPLQTTYVPGSAAPPQWAGPSPLVWRWGELPPGQSHNVVFSVQVLTLTTSISNVARLSSNETPVTTSVVIVHPPDPSAIWLASFTAAPNLRGGITVRWTTTLEINTRGFHLYRSATGQRADAVRITPDLIPGQPFGTLGGSYQFDDDTAQPDVTYHYWLQEVERDGAVNEYGPVTARALAGPVVSQVYLPLVLR